MNSTTYNVSIKSNYSQTPNDLILSTLSNGAFRLYCLILSKPHNDWIINATELSEGELGFSSSTTKRLITELKKFGLISVTETGRNSKGHKTYHYDVTYKDGDLVKYRRSKSKMEKKFRGSKHAKTRGPKSKPTNIIYNNIISNNSENIQSTSNSSVVAEGTTKQETILEKYTANGDYLNELQIQNDRESKNELHSLVSNSKENLDSIYIGFWKHDDDDKNLSLNLNKIPDKELRRRMQARVCRWSQEHGWSYTQEDIDLFHEWFEEINNTASASASGGEDPMAVFKGLCDKYSLDINEVSYSKIDDIFQGVEDPESEAWNDRHLFRWALSILHRENFNGESEYEGIPDNENYLCLDIRELMHG